MKKEIEKINQDAEKIKEIAQEIRELFYVVCYECQKPKRKSECSAVTIFNYGEPEDIYTCHDCVEKMPNLSFGSVE